MDPETPVEPEVPIIDPIDNSTVVEPLPIDPPVIDPTENETTVEPPVVDPSEN